LEVWFYMLKISPVSRDEKRWWLDTVERRNEIIKKEGCFL